MTLTDRYPTRRGLETAMLPREDPVVHPAAGPTSAVLDADTLARFESDGFLTIEHLLDPATVEDLKAELSTLAADADLLASERVVLEPDSKEVRSIFEVHKLSTKVAALVADERLAGPARQILGSDVYIHQSRVNFKPGFEGREFAWHSDFETWHAEDGMPAARAVSLSIALTPNYACNGSLMIVPGSHKTFVATVGETPPDHYRTSLRAQEVGVPDHDALARLVDTAGRIDTITGPAGSAVYFDCNVMHGSGSNITPYPRSNLFIVYNSVENTLVDPFAAGTPRPTFIASREFTPVR